MIRDDRGMMRKWHPSRSFNHFWLYYYCPCRFQLCNRIIHADECHISTASSIHPDRIGDGLDACANRSKLACPRHSCSIDRTEPVTRMSANRKVVMMKAIQNQSLWIFRRLHRWIKTFWGMWQIMVPEEKTLQPFYRATSENGLAN